ncbi:membrane progestin receptor gamma [Octopus bimaculoides]|uniref:Uncharacterized protein n=1 Tax=Octopus bimaculoides TaxID=37653 RepID=A0A0L8FTF7_OCTBM|nr:membrane progestin receptor gamma [Octopus bimaculoides]XP_052823228.1 membrane progestin receptor gamma [Octopus bimaculoides]XP_052823229.1 membrane progestin receptor gamma [Octopus bimaculoides]XP_052823230.1 membrane progestin receptor gamma [Octopus bimaculoides]XP_052823231.1 membrane progestin receptor gamma [Octopus bimaculoides]XP_052823232.1 membrane progestin receptor gamma [Octopus bimaculoides]|eukprot:XP_014787281.1 PREDICTED: membrane progestin receptor gamma-like [Octopus bimaculoides]
MAARIVIAARITDHIKLTLKKLIRHRNLEMMVFQRILGPLCSVEQIPTEFRENFILTGYRYPECTIFQCVCSIFTATNETFNFWTHFLPALYFLYTICQTYSKDFLQSSYNSPLIAYLVTCILFPFASSMAHMFLSLSNNARHICFFIDYGAVSLYSFGSSIAYRAYAFPEVLEYTWFGKWYLPIAFFSALLSTLFSCQSRFSGKYEQIFRIGVFSWPYFFDNIPIFILFTPLEERFYSKFYHTKQFLYCFMAVLMYVSHFPERFKPGYFDIVLHSHQLFHIFGIISTFYQMRGIQIDMATRKNTITKQWFYNYFHYSISIVLVQLLLIALIILLYTCILNHKKAIKKKE